MPDAKINSYRQAQIQAHSLCKTVFTFSFAQPKAKLYISRNFSGKWEEKVISVIKPNKKNLFKTTSKNLFKII